MGDKPRTATSGSGNGRALRHVAVGVAAVGLAAAFGMPIGAAVAAMGGRIAVMKVVGAVAVAVPVIIGVKMATSIFASSDGKSSSKAEAKGRGRPRRSSSYDFLPPNLSELRVVLLGNSWSQRSSVGNFILREKHFNTEEEPDCCLRASGGFKEKQIVLINTPDLLQPNISEDKLTQHVEDCRSLCGPGPHVFLLVLQPEEFTEELKEKLCRVLKLFSDQSLDCSLILISTPREETSGVNQPLVDIIKMSQCRYLWQENLGRPELFTQFAQIVREN